MNLRVVLKVEMEGGFEWGVSDEWSDLLIRIE